MKIIALREIEQPRLIGNDPEIDKWAKAMAREFDRWAEEQMFKVMGPPQAQLPLTVERLERICGIQRTVAKWKWALAKEIAAITIPSPIVLRFDP